MSPLRKELHNKNKKKNEEELDSPAKDELVPEKLERPDEPLEEAAKFLAPLLTLAANHINTHLLAFEIYLRKGKVLLMLRSIKQALAVDPDNVQLHSCVARFLNYVSTTSSLPDPVKNVVKASLPEELSGKTALELNNNFLQTHKSNLSAHFVAAKVMAQLEPSKMEAALTLISNMDTKGRTLETSTQILQAMQEGVFGSVGKSA